MINVQFRITYNLQNSFSNWTLWKCHVTLQYNNSMKKSGTKYLFEDWKVNKFLKNKQNIFSLIENHDFNKGQYSKKNYIFTVENQRESHKISLS